MVITLLETNRLMILPSIGVQPASPPVYIPLSDSPGDIQVTDLNADGNPDLATTLPGSNVLSVLYGRGNNQFARAQNISVGDKPTRVTLADADEDGRMDLIVANSGDNTASVIYNRFDPNEVYRYDSDAIDPTTIPLSIQSSMVRRFDYQQYNWSTALGRFARSSRRTCSHDLCQLTVAVVSPRSRSRSMSSRLVTMRYH